jgi:hypothetical protein
MDTHTPNIDDNGSKTLQDEVTYTREGNRDEPMDDESIPSVSRSRGNSISSRSSVPGTPASTYLIKCTNDTCGQVKMSDRPDILCG